MNYDLNKKITIGAARTLSSLQQTMHTLLGEMSFEGITVRLLCERAMVPRATFYKYFEDKYDLLEYCFLKLRQQTQVVNPGVSGREQLAQFLGNGIHYIDENWDAIQRVLKHNPPNQYFINQLNFYLRLNMTEAFKSFPDRNQCEVPREMVERLCSETVLIIFEQKCFLHKDLTEDQAKKYFLMLIGEIV